MRELKQFLQTRWVELLVAGVWLQSVISAAFTGSPALMALTTLDKGHVQPEIVDAWSVVEVRAKTGYLLDWLARHGVSPAETAVDITGGTSIMSAGAFSVAAERRVDCQYVRSDYDEDNRPRPNTQRGVFVTRYGRAEA